MENRYSLNIKDRLGKLRNAEGDEDIKRLIKQKQQNV